MKLDGRPGTLEIDLGMRAGIVWREGKMAVIVQLRSCPPTLASGAGSQPRTRQPIRRCRGRRLRRTR